MKTSRFFYLLCFSIGLTALSVPATFAGTQKAKEQKSTVHEIKLEAVVKDGTKYWLPSKVTVKKGERIHLRLDNHIPGPNAIHGFRLKDFHVEELVDEKGKDVEFTADRAGTFKYDCHLHPAHVGGEFIVEEK